MPLGTVDSASYEPALKQLWPQDKLDLIFYREHAFAALMSKADDFVGDPGKLHNVVSYAPPQGGGSFTEALANQSTGREADFIVSRKSNYQIVTIDNQSAMAAARRKGAVVPLLQKKHKDSLDNLSRNHALWLWLNEGGSRGRIGSQAGAVITLTSPADASRFEVDMQIRASLNDGSDAGHVLRADTALITKINRATGEITVDAIPGSWTNNDYLFRNGDFGGGYTGIPAWLPTDRSTLSTPFLTIDRSQDAERLAGSFVEGNGGSRLETVKSLAKDVRTLGGGRPDYCFVHPDDFYFMELEMENTVSRREDIKVAPSGRRGATIGFSGLMVQSGNSKIMVLEDINCPLGTGYVLQRDTWKFHHLGGLPHRATEGMGAGGGRAEATADAVQWRWRIFGNLVCLEPGKNGVCVF
ncbi:MAG: hypothetical protein AAGE52_38660 [Myxococcota bacterium]